MMTVGELVEALQKEDQEAVVGVNITTKTRSTDFEHIIWVEEGRLSMGEFYTTSEGSDTRAVRIQVDTG